MLARLLSPWVLGAALVFFLDPDLASTDAQWDFDGDLTSNTGHSDLVPLFASPATEPGVVFDIASINGEDAEVAQFTRGTYFDVPHGMPPNGGGLYVNQYTLIMDVMFPDRSPSGGWASLFQTNCCNQNDGDWFINPDGGIGIGGNYGGSVPEGEWHRLALVVDLTVGTLKSFVDGVQVQEFTGEALDGRFALYSPDDGDAEPYETFFIFADESGDNAEGFINSLQFHDLALDAGVIAEIGGPSATGIPKDVCIFPPAVATRDITPVRTAAETNGDFLPGDLIDVGITLSDIRTATPPCTAPAGVVIVETLPANWAPSQISDGGAHNAGVNTITWTVTGAALAAGKTLTYKVTAAATPGLAANFPGTVAENIPGAKPSPIRGESRLLTDVPFDDCGGIRSWNILGCFTQPANSWPDGAPGAGDNPGIDHMRLDFLSDGELFEPDFIWFPGAQIAPAYGGDGLSAAVSLGLQSGTRGANAEGVPEVLAWNDTDSFINLNDDVYGGDPNVVMAYLQCYVTNSGPDREVQIGVDSDDAVLVNLNDEEVWGNSVARGAVACTFTDKSPDQGNYPGPIILKNGSNKLVLKVFEGGGGFNAQFRFEDPETLEPITDLGIAKAPTGLCLTPPLKATRAIATPETVSIEHVVTPRWRDGETYDVSVTLAGIRAASGGCAAPTSVRIEETVPEGWTPSAPSNDGAVSVGKVTWNLSGAQIAAGTLTYKVKAAGTSGPVSFRGKVSEGGSPVTSAVVGASTLENPSTVTDLCFLKTWLLLGPYAQPPGPGASPGVTRIQQDHLCNGAGIDELTVEPRGGDTVNTSYAPGGCARSTGLRASAAPINPNGVPTWFAWNDADDTISFNNYYGGNLDQLMMYAVCYLEVDADVAVDIGLDSDDSFQLLLDGTEIGILNAARAMSGPGTVVDVISSGTVAALNPLTAGRHRLMVKVFEGGGDNGFRLRFQDPVTGEGICEGISVCLDPRGCAAVPAEQFLRGDGDGNSPINITDPIFVLNALFAGGDASPCPDAADADDSGTLNITDPIRTLNFLFVGGPEPPAPGPAACGPDPTEDGLGPCTYEC